MARLQILQLPGGAGDERPPFLVVLDQVDDELAEDIARWPEGVARRIGARQVLCFPGTIEIPANDLTAYSEQVEQAEASGVDDRARHAEAKLKALFDEAAGLQAERDEARQWARHGYEIGQRHCGWSDHGVAPAWLTEGWPPHIDSCEHLKQMTEFDMALTRVRAVVDSWCHEPHPSHDHVCPDDVRKAIHEAIYGSTDEETVKP